MTPAPFGWKETSMQETAHDVAKIQVGRAILQGCSWREAFRARRRYPDSAWKGGLFSYKPDVPALFIEKLFGLGWSLNWGYPQARLFLMGMVLTLVLSLRLVLLQQ
jgi:uncharacterized membrane protein